MLYKKLEIERDMVGLQKMHHKNDPIKLEAQKRMKLVLDEDLKKVSDQMKKIEKKYATSSNDSPEKGSQEWRSKPEDIDKDELEKELPPGSGIDEEEVIETDGEIHDPFDPTKIRVERSNPTIDLLIKRMQLGEINLSPDFQRKSGIWNFGAQSRLIESILIRIPLPAFYVDATNEDSWIVVDGLQRFTTLKHFILKKSFPLQGLEFLKEYEGCIFSDLPRGFQRRILEAEVTVFSIQKGTPEKVKFNIFKRINTGGLPLSAQEIRNALNGDRVRQFLNRLSKSNAFLLATNHGIRDTRMADRECVLRFLTFTLKDPDAYKQNDFDAFLNEAMRELNDPNIISVASLDNLESAFYKAMDYSRNLLGKWAFRKYYGHGYRLSPINKALFESWSVNLAKVNDQQYESLLMHKDSLMNKFKGLVSDEDFSKAISQATGSPSSVHIRFNHIKNIIEQVVKLDD